MSPEWIVVFIILIGGFGGVLYFLHKRLNPATQQIDSSEVIQTVISVAQQQLAGEKGLISAELTAKKDAIETLVKGLQEDIAIRQKEIRILEQDRNLKFGEISKSIDEHKKLTSDLQGSTEELRRVLSSSQLRGSWGERQIEQIFASIGFLQGQHFLTQTLMEDGTSKPDFTVLLPGGKRLCIDAKFPFANLQLMTQTEDAAEKQRFDRAFVSDVRDKVKEVADKGYISEGNGTCDYAVMFIPSESVFEYINRKHPEIVDEALTKKVLMASPYSLVAIVRTINEAYKNFYYESSMREIVKKVDVFLGDWNRFQEEFGRFGKSLQTTMNDYEQITGTRHKQMSLHIRQIQDARSGTKSLGAATQMPLDGQMLEVEVVDQ
jgi:DNA recombination protein RmuC